jgi:hypothetical protein
MQIDVLPDSDAVAREAAKFIAAEARAAIRARGRFLFAVSGGWPLRGNRGLPGPAPDDLDVPDHQPGRPESGVRPGI